MSVRSARITDVPSIRGLERQHAALALGMSPDIRRPPATWLALLSSFHAFGYRSQTLVLPRDARARGFVQAVARPGRESWDIVRLACLAPDGEVYAQACGELLERACVAAAQRGALRTFIRAPAESDLLTVAVGQGFRRYASELLWGGRPRALIEGALPPGADIRPREPRHAWDIFALYCANTPALVRHAEGRSLREWSSRPRGPLAALGMGRCREIVVGESGHLTMWLRWQPRRSPRVQELEVLVRPEAAHRLGEALRFAAEALDFDPDCTTLCRTREYDGPISGTLEMAGFGAMYHETLLVKHTVARVTERQLLIAALRAQGLGIDISHYHRSAEPAHQRLASSREAD